MLLAMLVVIALIIGLEHLLICATELFASPQKQAQLFDMEPSFMQQKAARVSMANQGIYNGMLGLVIILVPFVLAQAAAVVMLRLLLGLVVVVGIFGGLTATKKIFLVQMLPALIGLILLFVLD